MMRRDALLYFLSLARNTDARVSAPLAASIAESHLQALDRIVELEAALQAVTDLPASHTGVRTW